jgi:uncharacterized membrane protein
MSLDPLLSASLAIQAHALAALAALAVGSVLLVRRRGGPGHRRLGRIWVGLMAATALASLAIPSRATAGGWSPVHLLSAMTLAALAYAVAMARTGRVAAHRAAMRGLFVGALVITGGFTLMPGRIMHAVLFDPAGSAGPLAEAVSVLPGLAWIALPLALGLAAWLAVAGAPSRLTKG